MDIGQTLPPRTYWTAKEAASYLGVSLNTLYGYLKMRKNRPPSFRLAGKTQGAWRFPREEFIRWANGGQQKQG